MTIEVKPEADMLLEVSWEVCNKIGGIYTVLTSKTATIIDCYQNKFCAIGPYLPNSETVKSEFNEQIPPPEYQKIFTDLEMEGIRCHMGTWAIKGKPTVILVDFSGYLCQGNMIKTKLWDDYRVDSLSVGFDFTEPVVWGWAVGRLLEKLIGSIFRGEKVVAHFHEWLTGAALLYLKNKHVPAAAVFTTHATVLGRALAGNQLDFYSFIDKVEPDHEAHRYRIQAKHQLEKQAALHCDIMTTVSEITAKEVKRFLGRSNDCLLPNGFDFSPFGTFEELLLKHRLQRDRIKEFITYYFFPYYPLNLNETIFYFIACRYEFYNKGILEFIKALAEINQKLKQENSQRIIVAFFWVPTAVGSINQAVVENRNNYIDIKDFLDENSSALQENFLHALLSKDEFLLSESSFKDENVSQALSIKLKKFKKDGLPPLSTHQLLDANDAITKGLKEHGLENRKDDNVKVIFYPIYLNGSDGLLNLNYYEGIQGAHLGVFPSFYEPWGYTPVETAALAVPSLTTDLSGVGRFLMKLGRHRKYPGIFILKRAGKEEQVIVAELAKILYDFSRLSKEERIKNKINARETAHHTEWRFLVKYYIKAHNMAIKKNK